MSEADVEVVRGMFRALEDGELSQALEAADPALTTYTRPEEPGVEPVYHGLEASLEYMMHWVSQWEDWQIKAEEFVDAGGGRVLVVAQETAKGRDGIEIVESFTHVFELRGGKVVAWRQYGPKQEALAALGLDR